MRGRPMGTPPGYTHKYTCEFIGRIPRSSARAKACLRLAPGTLHPGCVTSTGSSTSKGEAVEAGHVVAYDQALFALRHALEVALDDLAGVRPGRDRVGIVGGPHDVRGSDEFPVGHSDRVVDERGVNLA